MNFPQSEVSLHHNLNKQSGLHRHTHNQGLLMIKASIVLMMIIIIIIIIIMIIPDPSDSAEDRLAPLRWCCRSFYPRSWRIHHKVVLVLLVLNFCVLNFCVFFWYLSGAHYITLAHSQEMEFKAAEQWDHDRGVSGGFWSRICRNFPFSAFLVICPFNHKNRLVWNFLLPPL